ncbi:patatin-like phospholipase family protein [Limnohabitans sp.]
MTKKNSQLLAIALSGGGIRSMAFHLGVLKCLAERGALERISKLSSVSGGSLMVGLILHHHGMRWPSSNEFLDDTYASMRERLCRDNLLIGALKTLSNPFNWRFLVSRANLLAKAIESVWGIKDKVSDLPSFPEVSLNGTTAENGKRFRFKNDSMGDYTLGYAKPQGFRLADAMAMSAAVPGVFGPLAVDASSYKWERRLSYGASMETLRAVPVKFSKLHLYDGGVYDNLGLEPLFDCATQEPKEGAEGCFILVSDAGAVLTNGFDLAPYNFLRFKRISDIQSDQIRSLRVRPFWKFIKRDPSHGAYLYIAEPDVPTDVASRFAVYFKTTLLPLTEHDFDAIAGRGYLVAASNTELNAYL